MLSSRLSVHRTKEAKAGPSALHWSALVVILSLLPFIALRIWRITTYSLWGGEAFTMIGVQQGWRDMFSYIVADIVHPPLMYILLRLWIMVGGESLLWLKLFPVLSGLAVVVPFLLLCRELNFGLSETSVALLMITVNGYLIHYTQELRMYSLFMFLAVCSFWLFIRLCKAPGNNRRQLLLLTFVNLLAIYTHYYGWVVVGMELLFLLVWQRRRAMGFALSVLFLLVCFAPWAYLVAQEARSIGGLARNLDWIPKPDVKSVLNLYVTFNGPLGNRYIRLFGLALFGFPVLLRGWQLRCADFGEQRSDLVWFSWLALLSFLPVIALFLISQVMEQAVWMDRYFIFIAIPYMMMVATAVHQVKPLGLRKLWIGAIVTWSLLAGFTDLRTNRLAWESPQLGSRIDWHNLVERMIAMETGTPGPIRVYILTVVSNGHRTGDWALSTSIDYFMDAEDDDRFETVFARDVYAALEQADESHFWVGYFDLRDWSQPSPAEVLAANGYQLGDALEYRNQQERLVLLPVWREP
jgi:hypothetical protein